MCSNSSFINRWLNFYPGLPLCGTFDTRPSDSRQHRQICQQPPRLGKGARFMCSILFICLDLVGEDVLHQIHSVGDQMRRRLFFDNWR